MKADRERMLPIGIENFEDMRTGNYYYVDKTGLIAELLYSGGKVTLFTRPRRFGKSLNMSMLESFFSPDCEKDVFEGLNITKETELCEKYMGNHPVISISLKDISAESFDVAYKMTADMIREAAVRVDRAVAGSDRLHRTERASLDRLLQMEIEESALYGSLYTLTGILYKLYGRKAVILIDEYDVPLAKAYEQGYYDRMVLLLRNIFHQALKTNNSLELAVLTGCMRISKESIFTGLNNLRVLGVADERADDYFGFTDPEVRELLRYYGLSGKYEEVREWYDGYRFGNEQVYCPWDVINYCDQARYNFRVFPENYWINSSGNHVVRELIGRSGSATVKGEIEALINGEAIEKTIYQELTYEEMYSSIDHIWSVLFTTGYLTSKERISGTRFRLVIPNREVREIFVEQILELFCRDVRKDGRMHAQICEALQDKDITTAENCLDAYLRKTISIRDTAVRRTLKENFYHGILLGILSARADWSVTSNQESGDGYSDILVRADNYELALIVEVKYAEDGSLEAVCKKALEQIEEKNYAQQLQEEGFDKILKYGVAFHRKKSRVMVSA